jgi:1,4-dihydroxy-6-naphthoate synthase
VMKIAFSPCPNDTFVFHAWVHGRIAGAPAVDVTYADIDVTNRLAASGAGPDVLKVSYAALPWVLDRYALLPCGGALGHSCGPLVLTRDGSADPAFLTGKRVAVPSERSTAYLLFRLWADDHVPGGVGEITVLPFDQIMPAVRDGDIDAGLVIHEARFTYPAYGLTMLVDLGAWWELDTGLPIPLGAIVTRRSLDREAIAGWVRESVRYAWSHPLESQAYVLSYAQEMDAQVAKAHIQLYVNEFTEELGDEGRNAVKSLLRRAAERGWVPAFDPTLLD